MWFPTPDIHKKIIITNDCFTFNTLKEGQVNKAVTYTYLSCLSLLFFIHLFLLSTLKKNPNLDFFSFSIFLLMSYNTLPICTLRRDIYVKS